MDNFKGSIFKNIEDENICLKLSSGGYLSEDFLNRLERHNNGQVYIGDVYHRSNGEHQRKWGNEVKNIGNSAFLLECKYEADKLFIIGDRQKIINDISGNIGAKSSHIVLFKI